MNAAGCDSIITIDLTINEVTDLTTTLNGTTITTNNNNATYQWLDCGNNVIIPGETSASFTPNTNGTYAVELTENGCVNTSDCITISTVGLSDQNHILKLQIYPNPTNGELTIDMGTTIEHLQVQITNITGEEVFTKNYDTIQKVKLNLNESPGVYFITVLADGIQSKYRLINE
jgi:hypothetical protein